MTTRGKGCTLQTPAQLKENLGALEWTLDKEHQVALDEVSQIDLGFPHPLIRESPYLFGNNHSLKDQNQQEDVCLGTEMG